MVRRLLWQNAAILLIAAAVAGAAAVVYVYLSNTFSANPAPLKTEIIAMNSNSVAFNSMEMSLVDTEKLLLSFSQGQHLQSINGVMYSLNEQNPSGNQNSKIITLTPVALSVPFYVTACVIGVGVFVITFFVAHIFMLRETQQAIVKPIVELTRLTDVIAQGELNSEIPILGTDEIAALSGALEQMRVKLRDMVAMQKKYDDNRKFLVSCLSHDLKTPVTIIKGYIEGLIDGVAFKQNKQDKYLATALDKTVMLNEMINDLLLYSKLDLNQLPFNLEEVRLNEYVGGIVAEYEDSYAKEGKRIAFASSLPDNYSIELDVLQFKRVAQNIIDNARRHIAAQGGELSVSLRHAASGVIFEFRDNGCGIAEQDLPRIFDRFYKAEQSRGGNGGSGLGLAISKQIVEGLGGSIWAINNDSGGSSFMVLLKNQR